jgi:hypothetical protein
VYDRRVKDRELTFGVSGKLHANSLVMYDHQTGSLWSHLVGAAVSGPWKGEKLRPLNSMFTRWETWKRLEPGSKVLSTGRWNIGAGRDPYEAYYRSADTGILPTRRSDPRLYPKEYVLGLTLAGRAKAYPFSVLSRTRVLNDTFSGEPLLVLFEPETATGLVYRRKLAGRVFSFELREARKGALLLVDTITGTVWDGLRGKALEGKLKGQSLEAIPSTPSFWFGWVDHYPDTELHLG